MDDSTFISEISKKSLDEKLVLVESLEYSSENDLEILAFLSKDEESEIRSSVAEVLVNSATLEAEKILISLLNDKISLVRANACDSLCNSSSKEVLDLLKRKVSKDRSSLVRGYAALSLADIAIRIKYDDNILKSFFVHLLEKEKSNWLRVVYYKVLYLLGDKSYFSLILNAFNNKMYRNRIFVVNTLGDICSEMNVTEIKIVLSNWLKNEKVLAVKVAIENVLNDI